jgi:type III restriction enzyme
MDKGAHFYRCDLQVHTPRDLNWAGSDAAVADDQRQAYAAKLVQACRERGLQGIAITDHHDMAFVGYIRRAAEEEVDDQGRPLPKEKQLVVFPGMELTLGVPCQALLIFDAEFPDDLFTLAMTALAINPSSAQEAKTAQVTRLQNISSLKQLKEKLDEHAYLRSRYIVLPNVGESGQFSLLRKGLAGKYAEMPFVGGYVDGSHTKLGEGNKKIVAGLAREWGNKRVALFQTSDNRRADHRDLGAFSTWIKWTAPTTEALRQACLAQESRVSQESPRLPSVGITAVSVSNSIFLGPIDLEFNPQYNALIGGRGTGKSTILEYVRWALCDQPPGAAEEDTPNYQARRLRLIDQTLKPVGATVQVSYEVNGVPHIVRRDSRDGSLLMKIADGDMRECNEDEVQSLLPIHAYSQKQLSDVSVRIGELSRFITAPIRSRLTRIDQQLIEKTERIRESYATRRRQRQLTRLLEKGELEQKSLTEQADRIRASLTGLSDDERILLQKGKAFEISNHAVQSWQDGISSFFTKAEELRSHVEVMKYSAHPAPPQPEPAILEAARAEYQALLSDAITALESVVDRAMAMTVVMDGEITSPWRQWSDKYATFKAAYEGAVAHSSVHADRMRQLKEIEDRLDERIKETERLKQELRDLAAAEVAYRSERNAWLGLLEERDELVQEQCASLTENSDGAIRARVRRHADPAAFVIKLRQYLGGSRVHINKIEAIGELITAAPDPSAQWNALLTDFEKLAEVDADTEGTEHRPDTPALFSAGFTATDIERVMRILKPDA